MNGLTAVFRDHDGVINCAMVHDEKPYPPVQLDDLEILPGCVTSVLWRLADSVMF
jgi:hypothetical protein